MTKQEREKRIVARGESGNHAHVLTGEVEFDNQGRMIVPESSSVDLEEFEVHNTKFMQKEIGYDDFVQKTKHLKVCRLRHLKESNWMEGEERWTEEHFDVGLKPGVYEYVAQTNFDPLTKRIELVRE